MEINKLNIFLNNQKLGQLILNQKSILFKYADSYLENGFNISPLQLNFDNSIQEALANPFEGLFGVFADSLPDAWGLLLMKRSLSRQSIQFETTNMLERLALVGENGLGALTYQPCISEKANASQVDLDYLNNNIDAIIKGESNEILDELFNQGGSPGGARPKIYVGYNSDKNEIIQGPANLPNGFEHWIIKFGAYVDPTDIANIEMAYYKMAVECGIEMMPCQLFKGKSGKVYFGTKRFDRIGNERVHMISSAGMFHDDYENSQMDYGTLLYETQQLINDASVQEQVFRRAVFNVYAHNRDDHSKNFAYLMDKDGNWRFAPAYDLTFSSSSQGFHSTKCAGNDWNPGEVELNNLADEFSIKNGKKIIAEVKTIIAHWVDYAKEFGVTKISQTSIQKTIESLLKK